MPATQVSQAKPEAEYTRSTLRKLTLKVHQTRALATNWPSLSSNTTTLSLFEMLPERAEIISKKRKQED